MNKAVRRLFDKIFLLRNIVMNALHSVDFESKPSREDWRIIRNLQSAMDEFNKHFSDRRKYFKTIK